MASHCEEAIYFVAIHGRTVPAFSWNFVHETKDKALLKGISVLGNIISVFDNDLDYKDFFKKVMPFCNYVNMIASDLQSPAIKQVFKDIHAIDDDDARHKLIKSALHPDAINGCHMHRVVKEGIPYKKFKGFIDLLVQVSAEYDSDKRLKYMDKHLGISRVKNLLSEEDFQQWRTIQSETPLIPESQQGEILSCYKHYVKFYPNSTEQLQEAITELEIYKERIGFETTASVTNGLKSLGVGYFAGFGIGAVQTGLQTCLGKNNSSFLNEILLSLLLCATDSSQAGISWMNLLVPFISALGTNAIIEEPSPALLLSQVVQYSFEELTSPHYPEVYNEFSMQMILSMMQVWCHTTSLLGCYHGSRYQNRIQTSASAMMQSSMTLFSRTTNTIASGMYSLSAYLEPYLPRVFQNAGAL